MDETGRVPPHESTSDRRLLEIGRIGKAHGLKGEVTVLITSDREERTTVGATWYIAGRAHTVAAIRPHQQRWIASLEGITTREAAEELRPRGRRRAGRDPRRPDVGIGRVRGRQPR
jgi:ribosomal 30S subunit maturation factor RimM